MHCAIDNDNDIWYNYGVNGIQGITVNNTEYVFRKNVQGDVTHIYKLNTEGTLTLAARYKYDAWGKCEVTEVDGSNIGAINPIRYRGYYYDTDTGLYYLNARYYDPEVGRFISADDTQFLEPNTINGLNLYAYCGNNPVMNVDPSGHFIVGLIIGFAIAGAVVGAVTVGKIVHDVAMEAGYTGGELLGLTILGALGGGIIGAGVGALMGAALPAIGTSIGASIAFGGIGIGAGGVAVAAAGGLAAVAVAGVIGFTILFARTPKQDGYYGERWPGDHKPDHVHLRGNDIDIRIGKDGLPLDGEPPLSSQARKALKKLWKEILKLFDRW